MSRPSIRGIALIIAAGAPVGCRDAPASVVRTPHAAVPFETMVRPLGRTDLAVVQSDRPASPVGTLTTESRIAVLDRARAELRLFSRDGGELQAIAATPGDARGQLRKPAAIVPIDAGRFIVLDAGRHLLSIRDSLGGVVSEAVLPEGAYSSVVAVAGEHRVVVAGRIYYGADSIRARDLHEFDHDGRHIASYGARTEPPTLWARAFSTVLVAGRGARLASATLATNNVRLLDRQSREERWMRVAPEWYVTPQFPDDRVLKYRTTQQTASARVMAWTRQQRLLNGLFLLPHGRMVARFQAFDPSGGRFYYYALTTDDGATWSVSRPTRINVLEARGDTLSWIETTTPGRSAFVTGVIAPRTPVPQIASRAP